MLDLEFAVAQSLGFEFWVRGADKPLRGWSLDLQTTPDSITAVQNSLPTALQNMYASRGTDAEFLFAPSQVALACWRLAARELVDAYLVEQYAEAEATGAPTPYGAPREDLLRIISDVEDIVRAGTGDLDLKKVKEVDKRLKACTNPEKIPGTALYIKRKAEQDDKASEAKAEKVAQARARAEADEFVFGAPIKREQSASASASASAAASATAKPTAPTGLAPSPLSPKKTVKSEDPF